MILRERINAANEEALRRIVAADPLAREMAPGFHAEGPFISNETGYRGAHPADAVLPATLDAAAQLLDAAGPLLRILTLAPECDPAFRVTRVLADRGVIVSAGHTTADLDFALEKFGKVGKELGVI